MAGNLPQFVVLKSEQVGYLNFRDSHIMIDGLDIFDPYCKIAVERAKINDNYVHLRFCATNKYWSRGPYNYLHAIYNQPEEDRSKPSCTLFEPYQDEMLRFTHVPSGWLVAKDDYNGWLSVDQVRQHAFSVVDWASLVKLPKRVAFKAYNDKYIQGVNREGHPYNEASSDDGNRDATVYEIEPKMDGHVLVRSVYYDRFWRRSPNWIWADNGWSGGDKDTLFWAVKVDDRTVALRNAGNNNFIKPLTTDGKTDCLNAAVDNITNEAKLVVEELVSERKIFNTKYRMDEARILDETPFVAGVETATNSSDRDSTMTVAVKYEESSSFSFNNSFSIALGVKTEIQTGIPFIAEGKIEFSAEVTNTFEWNRTTTETKSVEATYSVTVPAKSRARVTYVGTRGTCNIPFSYSQQDKSSTDGQIISSEHIDGIFNGINCYNYHFEQPAVIPL